MRLSTLFNTLLAQMQLKHVKRKRARQILWITICWRRSRWKRSGVSRMKSIRSYTCRNPNGFVLITLSIYSLMLQTPFRLDNTYAPLEVYAPFNNLCSCFHCNDGKLDISTTHSGCTRSQCEGCSLRLERSEQHTSELQS